MSHRTLGPADDAGVSVRSRRPRATIIVAYHQPEQLAKALDGIDPDERVVVVDNSSDDRVRAIVDGRHREYVDAGRNRGFAGGVNLGLRCVTRRADAGLDVPDVLLLNPDAHLPSAVVDAMQVLFDSPGGERLAAVSPELVRPDGERERVAWPFPTPWRMVLEAVGLGRYIAAEDFVVGAALLLRAEALKDVGMFDERYFLYAEECDWQRRAVDRGWRSMCVRWLQAEHVGGGSSADDVQRERLLCAGQETYVRSRYGLRGWFLFRVAALVGYGARGLVRPGTAGAAARRRALDLLKGHRIAAGLPPFRETGRVPLVPDIEQRA